MCDKPPIEQVSCSIAWELLLQYLFDDIRHAALLTASCDQIGSGLDFIDGVLHCDPGPWLGVYPDIGNLKNAAVIYGTDVVEDMYKGAGHLFAVHLKETKPGHYRDMDFGTDGHTEYVRCIKAALDMGVRTFTGEFWYQKGQDYEEVIGRSSKFLRAKIEEAAAELA